eukprot:1787087-Prymnesium_polylepis.1
MADSEPAATAGAAEGAPGAAADDPLSTLLPPPDFSPPLVLHPSELPGAFGQLHRIADPIGPSGAVGRALGGDDHATAARWAYLEAHGDACQAAKTSVAFYHIFTGVWLRAATSELDWSRAVNALGGRYCASVGRESLLVAGTPRFDVCVTLARHLAPRAGEDPAAYSARVRRHDAWAAACAFEKPGIALL